MTNWREVELSEIAHIIPGYAFKSNQFGNMGELVIKIKDISPPIIDLSRAEKVQLTSQLMEKLSKYRVSKGDYVVAMTGATIGKIGKLKIAATAYINQRVARIYAKSGINDEFVYFSINTDSFQAFVQNNIDSNSAQENISGTSIGRFPIKLPSLPEQTAIAEVLSSLDDKIDLLRRQNKTLEQLSETLFKQWFVVEADESWETVKISEVAAINKRTISKGFPFDEIEYLDTGSITEGKIESFQKYLLKDAPSRAQRLVNENDIVYSLVRPIQRHYGLLHDVKPNTVASTGFCVISCEKITPYFIYVLLTQNETVEYLDMIAEGSTSAYPSLKPSDISSFEFQLPPKFKLDEFAEIAETNWNKIKSNTKQIRTLTKLRETLLPKLMSGEIRVKYK